MKRAKNLFPILISDDNIKKAIQEVNRTHRWHRGRPNRVTVWVEKTKEERVKELREIILNGYEPGPARHRRRYDKSAGKWRDIWEPLQWPDQYIHHMIIQVLQPVMMRGMDYWCCGSIRKRGTSRGIYGIKKWIATDRENTKYAAELDIRHFYESLTTKVVMKRVNDLIKDPQMMDVIRRLLKNGILIGAYFSQWFANTVLQPLDHAIREEMHVKHYVRYMDNLTIFGRNKKELHKAVREIGKRLSEMGLQLKENWQVYRTSYTRKVQEKRRTYTERQLRLRMPRLVTGMGYRYGAGKTLLRKRNLLRLKRQLAKTYKCLDAGGTVRFRTAAGLLSRIGQLKHCDCTRLRERIVRPGLQRFLKGIVRAEMKRRKERMNWESYISLAA